jgi:hypothetical protein
MNACGRTSSKAGELALTSALVQSLLGFAFKRLYDRRFKRDGPDGRPKMKHRSSTSIAALLLFASSVQLTSSRAGAQDRTDQADRASSVDCGTVITGPTVLCKGATPAHGFMVCMQGPQPGAILWISDNGVAEPFGDAVAIVGDGEGGPSSCFTTPVGYRPIGPINVNAPPNSVPMQIFVRAW